MRRKAASYHQLLILNEFDGRAYRPGRSAQHQTSPWQFYRQLTVRLLVFGASRALVQMTLGVHHCACSPCADGHAAHGPFTATGQTITARRHPLDQQNTRLLRVLPGLEAIAKTLMGVYSCPPVICLLTAVDPIDEAWTTTAGT